MVFRALALVHVKYTKEGMPHIENSDGDQAFPDGRQSRVNVSKRPSMRAKNKPNPQAKRLQEPKSVPELPKSRSTRGKSPDEKQREVILLLEHLHCFITDHYGPRCSEFKGGCRICAMWAAYDLVDAMICE